MCKISDKLKLCTCAPGAEISKHFWELHRGENKQFLVGEIMPTPALSSRDEEYNQQQLLAIINSDNCFDTPIQFQEKDELILFFKVPARSYESDHLVYPFIFRKGRWRKHDYNPFDGNETTLLKGEIQDPFQV